MIAIIQSTKHIKHIFLQKLLVQQLKSFELLLFIYTNISSCRINKMVNEQAIQIESKDQAFLQTYLDDQPFYTSQRYSEGKQNFQGNDFYKFCDSTNFKNRKG